MRGRATWVSLLAGIALVLPACGVEKNAPSGAASTSASPTTKTANLLVVADPSPYSGSQAAIVRFFGLDGHEVSHVQLAANTQIVGVAGARVFAMGVTGALTALHRDGSIEDLGNIGADVPFAASPDGKRWVWSTSIWQGQTITSVVHMGGDGLIPRAIETATEDTRSLRPYEWTSVGLFVEHGVVGIGGYILYLGATGPVDRLDPDKNTATPISGSDKCSFSDMSADGTIACFPFQPHTVRIVSANGRVSDIGLSTPRFNLSGDAYFSRDGQQLSVAGAVGSGTEQPNGEHYGTDLIKNSDATITRISVDGVRPANFMRAACWLPDNSLVTYRPGNSADGPSVTVIYRPGGTSTSITTAGMPVGLLTG